jgi:ElaB/YqjD/DUF883 family membrane-anchored ribosome-binding protein
MATEITGGNARDVQEALSTAKESLRSAYDSGRERAAHYRDVAMERGRNALSTAERTIQDKPLIVLGCVFAGGLMLGWLLSRK